MKKFFKTQIGRFVAGLLALIVLVGAVSAVRLLPLKADVTPQKFMTMSDRSREVVGALEEDVDVYYLASDAGKELWVDELLQRYDAASAHVSYEMVDPTSGKATDLATAAKMALTENSLVVMSGRRTICLSKDSMYDTEYNDEYYYYYGEQVVESQYFMADSEVMNAILYVTRNDLPVLYTLTGHGEISPAGTMLNTLQVCNVAVEELRLDGAVPEDAAAVMIYGPSADITKEEADALLTYLKDGGNVVLLTDYLMSDMPNLESVAAYYGMQSLPGLVVDMQTGYCYSTDYPQYLRPDVSEHAVTATLSAYSAKPVISYACAMERNDVTRSGLTVTTLLTTSDAAYMKDSQNLTTAAQEEGDAVGRFTVGMAAEEADSHFVWFTSASFLDDTDVSVSSGANLFMMKDMFGWMMTFAESESFRGGNMVMDALAVPASMPTTVVYAALFVPALIALAIGLIGKRRKKV